MNIAFSINQAHLFFAFVTINSILTNNPSSFFNIYILHDNSVITADVNKYNKTLIKAGKDNFRVELIDVTKHPKFNQINYEMRHWGKEIFYKILLPSLLPKIDRILTLDTDVIVKGDITDIYNTNLDDYCFAADFLQTGWINVGILLYNLENIRKNKVENQWLEGIKDRSLNEEAVLNRKFRILTRNLSNCYTIWDIKEPISNVEFSKTKIIHCIARKPWHIPSSRNHGIKVASLWFQAVTVFIKPSSKPVFYLVKLYGIFIAKSLYALIKKTPLGKHVYKSSYTMLKKVII